MSNERCKRRRSSATIANCNTYSPHPVRNSRGASGQKPTPSAPLLTVSPRRLLCHWQRAAPSCRKSSAARWLAQARENGQLPECRQNKRPCNAWSFVLLDSGGYLLSRVHSSQWSSSFAAKASRNTPLLTGLSARFIAHWARSPTARLQSSALS